MKHRQTRRFAKVVAMASFALIATAPPVADAGPDARTIMDKVAQTRKLDGSEAVLEMTIIDKHGNERKLQLAMASKLFDDGKTEKRIYRFLSPPDVKGTGVLVFDYEIEDDSTWVYLPALRRVRRIVSAKRSKSFMGSEFSYADLNIPSLDDYTYALLREESEQGEDCWVIEVLPKDEDTAKADGYSKKTYWVAKADHTVRKGLLYDLDGELLKEFLSRDIELLDPDKRRYRSTHMEMTNKQNGRKSVFESSKVVFSPDVKSELFTTRELERM